METPEVFSEPYDIKNALTKFDASLDEFRAIALEAIAARNEATPLHPANAAGTYSYMSGVAALRMIFLQKPGWKKACHTGVEVVSNEEKGIMILFQNVDFACGQHDPSPLSAKKSGVSSIVDNPSEYLFPEMQEEDKKGENQHAWFFCVSCNGDELRAELSRPSCIKNGNFGTFAERIFIVQANDLDPIEPSNTDDTIVQEDFDVNVTKKNKQE